MPIDFSELGAPIKPKHAPQSPPPPPGYSIGRDAVAPSQIQEAQKDVGDSLAQIFPLIVLIGLAVFGIAALTHALQHRADVVLRNMQTFGNRPNRKRKHRHHGRKGKTLMLV